MERHHIPVSALHMGQRIYIEPQRANLPRGPKLQGVLAAGPAALTPWLFDLCQRGEVLAFDGPPAPLSNEEANKRREQILKFNKEAAAERAAAAGEEDADHV